MTGSFFFVLCILRKRDYQCKHRKLNFDDVQSQVDTAFAADFNITTFDAIFLAGHSVVELLAFLCFHILISVELA